MYRRVLFIACVTIIVSAGELQAQSQFTFMRLP